MKLVRPVTLSATEGSLARASSGTYIDGAGVLQTAGVNVARYQGGGVLIEAAATNLLLRSQEFDNAAWAKGNTAVTANAAVAPDGASTAELVAETAALAQFNIEQIVSVTANTNYTLSVFVKAALSTKVVLYWLKPDYSSGVAVLADLGAGTASEPIANASGSGVGASITALSGGWYRLSVTGKIDAVSTSALAALYLADAGFTLAPFVGTVGRGVYVWGAQLERAASPTSYYATTSGTATRAADVITGTAPCLLLSTVPEPDSGDPAAYNAGTTYALDHLVRRAATHRIYQSLQAGNTGNTPESSALWWEEVSGVNRWAMFDDGVSSATTGTSPLRVVLEPGIIDALVLLGMVGNTATVTITDGRGGPVVYGPRVINLQVPVVADWYSYYFEPFRQVPSIILTDLPPYLNAVLTVTVEGSGTVACGMCIPGRTYEIGGTQYGVSAGIRDYSRKVVNETTGRVTLEQRKFAKTLTAQVRADAALYNEIHEQLEALRAVPCVWIADKSGDIAPLTVFGFYKDFSLLVDYPTAGIYRLEIEGMI